jgi:SAM-dependent methyltransferase
VKFELLMTSVTSLNNYEYLDILDRAWSHAELPRPSGGVICDIGCASFWYAAALTAFFKPRELVGVEVEGYRLFKNGHTRIDHAKGYVSQFPNAHFVVADYVSFESPADVITAWFPFLTPTAILAWRLPLSLLAPERLFQRIYHNLNPGGLLVMVNHGESEAALAEELCVAAGLRRMMRLDEPGVLSARRLSPAILSCWSRPQHKP